MRLKNVTALKKNQNILDETMIKIRNNTLQSQYKYLR